MDLNLKAPSLIKHAKSARDESQVHCRIIIGAENRKGRFALIGTSNRKIRGKKTQEKEKEREKERESQSPPRRVQFHYGVRVLFALKRGRRDSSS